MACSLVAIGGLAAAPASSATTPVHVTHAIRATSADHAADLLPSATALPQIPASRAAGGWLASQFIDDEYIPASGSTTPDLSATAQAVLALSAANVDLPLAQDALNYLHTQLDQYVDVNGADSPGPLALLILDSVALGDNPTQFGGTTNLVAMLLATQQTSGSSSGLFGTANQVANYAAGTYDQGLALAALAAAGVTGTSQVQQAISWLDSQQCAGGGWTLPDQTLNACSGLPVNYAGPDTNTTSIAAEGLAAEGAASSSAAAKALTFLQTAQDADAGWSYYPSTPTSPQSSDPDSTAFVMQGLTALGSSPTSPIYRKGSDTPVSTLLSFQLTSGSGAGAFIYPPAPAPANIIATYQAIPALANLPLPFGASGHGYWAAASDGGVFQFGDAGFYGSLGDIHLNAPVVAMAPTPDGKGYWLVASDGGVFQFGDASFYGSLGNIHLNAPIVAMAATPDGKGYWLVASDGGVFEFGDAGFYGSLGNIHLNQPIVGVASVPGGAGYWLVASDGGVFEFGDAGFYGSLGNIHLNQPIVGAAASPNGTGYWLVASDGGVFEFGDASFYGSLGNIHLNKPIVSMTASPDGAGYWLVASDGGVFQFGDASFYGSLGNIHLNQPIVASTTGRG
jgi:hypothetical protein